MRLYRCRLDMRACHPASAFAVTGWFRRGFHAPPSGFHRRHGHIARFLRAGKSNVAKFRRSALQTRLYGRDNTAQQMPAYWRASMAGEFDLVERDAKLADERGNDARQVLRAAWEVPKDTMTTDDIPVLLARLSQVAGTRD